MATAALVFIAIFCTSLVHAQDPRCATKSDGDTTELPVQLPVVNLPPPTRMWDVHIPQNVCPPPLRQVGVKMMVCDPDGPPAPSIVFINDDHDAIVQRNAYQITQTAKVYTTVYCKYPPFPSRNQSVVNVVKATPSVRQ